MASITAVSYVTKKLKAAVKAKLLELGIYIDDELPDYIMLLVTNKKPKSSMKDDLSLFMGKNTDQFVDWLFEIYERLQSAADANGDPLDVNNQSDVLKAFDDVAKKVLIKPNISNELKSQSMQDETIESEKKRKQDRKVPKETIEKDSNLRERKNTSESLLETEKHKRRKRLSSSSDRDVHRKHLHSRERYSLEKNSDHKRRSFERTAKCSESKVHRRSRSRSSKREQRSKLEYDRKGYCRRENRSPDEKMGSRRSSPSHEKDHKEENFAVKETKDNSLDKKVASCAISKMREPGSPAKVSSKIIVKRKLPETLPLERTGAKRLFQKAMKDVNEPSTANQPFSQTIETSNAVVNKKHSNIESAENSFQSKEKKVKESVVADKAESMKCNHKDECVLIASENENIIVDGMKKDKQSTIQNATINRAPKITVTLTRDARDNITRRVTERIAARRVLLERSRIRFAKREPPPQKRKIQRSYLSARMRMYQKRMMISNREKGKDAHKSLEKVEHKRNTTNEASTSTAQPAKKPKRSVSIFGERFDLDDESDSDTDSDSTNEDEAEIDAAIASMNGKMSGYNDKAAELVALKTKSKLCGSPYDRSEESYNRNNLASTYNDPSQFATAMSRSSLIPCRYGGSCRNSRCLYQHPKLCRFAERCTNNECPYRHVKPLDTIAVALKEKYTWKASNNA